MVTQLSRDIKVYGAVLQEDGSYLDMFETVIWYNEKGMLHNELGPALVTHDGICEWWINGLEYTFDEWFTKMDKNSHDYTQLIYMYGYNALGTKA
jgi:hypothetical protein